MPVLRSVCGLFLFDFNTLKKDTFMACGTCGGKIKTGQKVAPVKVNVVKPVIPTGLKASAVKIVK